MKNEEIRDLKRRIKKLENKQTEEDTQARKAKATTIEEREEEPCFPFAHTKYSSQHVTNE
ncbi:hypothetical protein TSAR_007738 [Trichomalopsis sarcophagae]|uniref:Uncharacterized protein n=1 Tax=Trichomalopsis sarcophagae TaxID=543379 RepID=A0A232EJK3_9HYME|nr:hypothetical protein TSAR_007738 [Trichomalopsis sarcophagae]